MFVNSPVSGLVVLSDEGIGGILAEIQRSNDAPLTREQRALLVLVLSGAVFSQSVAIEMCRSILLLMDEGVDNLMAHLMLVDAGVE